MAAEPESDAAAPESDAAAPETAEEEEEEEQEQDGLVEEVEADIPEELSGRARRLKMISEFEV